jgi:hypothetical protein
MSEPQNERRGGNPPEAYRFKKGQSGNRRGRPKGSKNTKTLFAQELAAPIVIHQNGKRTRVRRGEALVKGIVNDALGGKDRPRDITLRMAEQIDHDDQSREAEQLSAEDQAICDRYVMRRIREMAAARRSRNHDPE